MGEGLMHLSLLTVLSCNSGVSLSVTGDYGKHFGLATCCCFVKRSIMGRSYGMADGRICFKFKKSGMKGGNVWFRGMNGVHMRRNRLSSVDSVIAGESFGEESLPSGRENVDLGDHEVGLPPWGIGEVGQGAGFESRNVSKLLKSSDKMICVDDDDDKVLFLEERDERVLSVRLLSLSRCNQIRSALGLFRSMKLSGLLPGEHACNSLLSCLLRNEMHSDASYLLEFMKINKLATGHSYCLMLKSVGQSKGFDAVIKMFWELERDGDTKNKLDIVVYNSVITACADVNNGIQAEKIWSNMKENGIHGNSITYCILVCTFVRCGHNDMAINAYNEMVQHGLELRKDAMQAVIGACSKEGNWEMAQNVFQKMLDSKLSPSLATCNILINMLGKAGTFGQAYKVYEIMRSLGHVPDAYTWKALLGSLYQAKRYNDVLNFFETVRKENSEMLNAHLYNTVLMSCKKLRSWEKALQLLWLMEASGLPVDVMSYNIVLNTCEVARKPKVAMQVYDHMIQQNCSPDTFTYMSLIRACIWGSTWDTVEEILKMVPPNSSLYNAAVQGMFLRGKLHAARKLYKEMLGYDLEPDGKTRVFILQTYKKLPERKNL